MVDLFYSEMKIQNSTAIIIIFRLFLLIEGVVFIERSVQEGETFIFHLSNLSDRSDISSVEWKEMKRTKLLAIISVDDNNNTMIFNQESRIHFMQNGSIAISNVKQEDTGNYTCRIIFRDKNIQTHIISLTLHSESTEQNLNFNTTAYTSVPQALNIWQIVAVVSSLGGLLLLAIVTVIIVKCRRKRTSIQEEPIYYNTYQKHEENQRTHKRKSELNHETE